MVSVRFSYSRPDLITDGVSERQLPKAPWSNSHDVILRFVPSHSCRAKVGRAWAQIVFKALLAENQVLAFVSSTLGPSSVLHTMVSFGPSHYVLTAYHQASPMMGLLVLPMNPAALEQAARPLTAPPLGPHQTALHPILHLSKHSSALTVTGLLSS